MGRRNKAKQISRKRAASRLRKVRGPLKGMPSPLNGLLKEPRGRSFSGRNLDFKHATR